MATKSKSTAKRKSQTTTDPDEIRQWAEAHGGKPAAVAATESDDDPGIIRIMFPDAPNAKDDALEEIEWDEWFEKFDECGLALIYDPKSNFNKVVSCESIEEKEGGKRGHDEDEEESTE
ncbi:MAG TPA: hypothetical protein VGB82_29505 [Alphaproteobacteria bacterium]